MSSKFNNPKLGQRSIHHLVKKRFEIAVSENTIAGWLYQNNIPFANEATQFKFKKKPSKKNLQNLYLERNFSLSDVGTKFNVSAATVIKWLDYYEIPRRDHMKSMNTNRIKITLAEKRLKKPLNLNYKTLSLEKAYIIGVLCGDAFIDYRLIRLEIKYDKEFIDYFSECLYVVYGIKYPVTYYPPKNSFVLQAYSQIICADLMRYSKTGYLTFDWEIPHQIFNSKKKSIISSFLKGFYDSEGSFSGYCLSVCSSNLEGLKQISYLLDKLNIKNTLASYDRRHIINITGKGKILKFYNFVNFTILRKRVKLENYIKYVRNYSNG